MICHQCRKEIEHHTQQVGNICIPCIYLMISQGANAKSALVQAVKWLFPDQRRGPQYQDWIEAMKEVAGVLEWPKCDECAGTGQQDDPPVGYCWKCRGIGKINPLRRQS